MKIVCEACQAKYSISDDKVRGKAFKIRCKKCSHIIVVRSGEGSGLSPQPEPVSVPTPAAEAATWHIVVDGEQVGPLSESDVRARLSRGEITGETYIWREGMGDWLKISTVPEFGEGKGGAGYDEAGPFPGGGAQAPAAYPPGTAEGAFAASAENGELDAFAAPTMVSSSAAASELFASPVSAPAAAPEPQGFSFGASAPASEGGGGGGRHAGGGGGLSLGNGASAASSGGGGLTGQRHENSVLFSLSNLEALAAPPSAAASPANPRPGSTAPSEGSGLIDIRSMAAMTLGTSASESRPGGELPTFAAPQFSPVAPVLLPIAPVGGPSRWQYGLLAALIVVAAGLGVAIIMLVKSPDPTPVATTTAPGSETVTAPVAPAKPAAAPAATAPPATPTPSPDENLPPREEKPAATATSEKPSAKPDRPRTSKGGGGGDRKAGGRGEGGGRAVAAAPAAAAAPEPSEKPNVGKGDKLDDLLNAALGSKRAPTTAGSAGARAREEDDSAKKPAAASLGSLGKEDIVRGIQGVMPRVKECYNNYKVPGTANVNISVARGGRVSDAKVTGKFAGTPTGNCVETAIKQAKFPPTEAQNFPYPIFLR